MTPSPLRRHGEYFSPICRPQPDGSGAFGQSTPEDRPQTLGRGVQERYRKDVSAAPNTYAFGWIRAAYADAIEYSGIPNEGRGVVFSMGVIFFLMAMGAAIYGELWPSRFDWDDLFGTILGAFLAIALALIGISALIFGVLFEFSNPPVDKGVKPDSEGKMPRPVIQLKALAHIDDLMLNKPASDSNQNEGEKAFSLQDCVNPESEAENDPAGPYEQMAGRYRWLRLSSGRQLLAAQIRRSEGYAGGSGSFTAELLLDIRDGKLVPVGCYAVSRYQMFGGSWNRDGTRQHPESIAAWKPVPLPGGKWPKIRLQPTTAATPSAILVWDEVRGQYIEDVRKGKKRK